MPDLDLERRHLDALLAVLALPATSVTAREGPDFSVALAGRTIGVELTEYMHPRDPVEMIVQEQHGLQDRAVQAAHRLFGAQGGPTVDVAVYFQEGIRLHKSGIRSLAQEIAAAVEWLLAARDHDGSRADNLWQRLPTGVSDLSVRYALSGLDPVWQAPRFGWAVPVEPRHLQPILTKKEPIVHLAIDSFAELWLTVIFTPSRGRACTVSSETLSAEYFSSFSRVLWFDHARRFVTDIRLTRSG